MGLVGGMARTAVVAGTATAVSNRVSRRQANRWSADQQQQIEHEAYQQQQYAPPPPQPTYAPPPPAAEDMDDKIEKLKQIGALRDQGILTDAEFEVQKAKILAG